jgi:hypothetical protein
LSTTAILEIVGAIGLLVGLLYNSILLISPGGLALLMFLSNSQAKIKDGLLASSPALFYFKSIYLFFTYQCKVYSINDSVIVHWLL